MSASFPKVSWLPGSPRQQWCQLPAARCTESDSLALCSCSGPVSMRVHIGWDWKSGEQARYGWLHTSSPSCSTGLGGKVSILYAAKPRCCLSMMCCHICCISTNFGKLLWCIQVCGISPAAQGRPQTAWQQGIHRHPLCCGWWQSDRTGVPANICWFVFQS